MSTTAPAKTSWMILAKIQGLRKSISSIPESMHRVPNHFFAVFGRSCLKHKVVFAVTTLMVFGLVEKSGNRGLLHCLASGFDAVGVACKRVPSNNADAASRTVKKFAVWFRHRPVFPGHNFLGQHTRLLEAVDNCAKGYARWTRNFYKAVMDADIFKRWLEEKSRWGDGFELLESDTADVLTDP